MAPVGKVGVTEPEVRLVAAAEATFSETGVVGILSEKMLAGVGDITTFMGLPISRLAFHQLLLTPVCARR